MIDRDQITVSWGWSVWVNRPWKTPRERVAYALRKLAQRIDGQLTMGVEIKTAPRLKAAEVEECVRAAIQTLSASVKATAHQAAVEQAMRDGFPELQEREMTSMSIRVVDQGDANEYALVSEDNHWFAAVRMNGEWSPARQRQVLDAFAAAMSAPSEPDWTVPTSALQRMSDAVTLLCAGHRPPEAMVAGWLDGSSEALQAFAAEHGPAWSQGIAVLDAARVMAEQPTEGVAHARMPAADEDSALRDRMRDILQRTAIAIRGPEPPLRRWSWHDLPERAAAAIAAIDVMQRAAARAQEPLTDPDDDPPAREGTDYVVPPRTDGLIGVAALAKDAAERANVISKEGGAA